MMSAAATIAVLWKHKRNMDRLFGGQIAIPRSLYVRIFTLGVILLMTSALAFVNCFPAPTEFYAGWSAVHGNWTPVAVTAHEWHAQGSFVAFTVIWNEWINVWLAVALFGLFGLTRDTRAMYVQAIKAVISLPRKTLQSLRRTQSGVLSVSLPPSTEKSSMTSMVTLRCVRPS